MLLTAINFLPAALFRLPILPPERAIIQAFGGAILIALAALGWHTWKHRRLNKTFAVGIVLMIVALPLRIAFGETELWLNITAWLVS